MDQPEDLLSMSVRDFIAATAARTPTPGGGSVAGVVAALGAGLGEMSLNFTRGKKKYAEHEQYYAHLGARMEKFRAMFAALVSDDVQAYKLYQESSRMADGPDKQQAVAVALAAAINVPRELAKTSLALLADMLEFQPKCSPMLISDLVASAALAAVAVKLSDYNVRINVPHLGDRQMASEIQQSSAADVVKAQAIVAQIEKAGASIMP